MSRKKNTRPEQGRSRGGGVDPDHYYDTRVLADHLLLSRTRRQQLQNHLMRDHRREVIRNGKGALIVEARLAIEVLWNLGE